MMTRIYQGLYFLHYDSHEHMDSVIASLAHMGPPTKASKQEPKYIENEGVLERLELWPMTFIVYRYEYEEMRTIQNCNMKWLELWGPMEEFFIEVSEKLGFKIILEYGLTFDCRDKPDEDEESEEVFNPMIEFSSSFLAFLGRCNIELLFDFYCRT